MELEDTIMRNVMRIASNARRMLPKPPAEECRKYRGFGHILDLLAENGGLTQRQISDALDIRPQSASEAIANMESSGLIRREVNELDRRSSVLYLTPAGQERQTALLEARRRNAMRIFSALDAEEKNTLLSLLEKVTVSLQDQKEEAK